MIEFVCDVVGCETRAPAGHEGLLAAPSGWSVLIASADSELEKAAARKFDPGQMRAAMRRMAGQKSLICPNHPLPKVKPRPAPADDLDPFGAVMPFPGGY